MKTQAPTRHPLRMPPKPAPEARGRGADVSETAPETAAVAEDEAEADAAGLRRCLASGARREKAAMIRLVVGPGDELVPDLAERLPGRGLWITASRDMVEKALEKRLFAKAAKARVEVTADLADRLEGLLRRRALDIVGLAFAAGAVHQGFDQAEAWCGANRPRLGAMVVARDASAGGRRKFLGLGREAPVVDLFSAVELGGAIGRSDAVYMAIERGGLCARLCKEANRLAGFVATPPIQG